MYGNRDAGRSKFISPVVKGGINYVKSLLDTYTDRPGILDDGIEHSKPHGYTPHDILCFCNKFRIKCFGYNFKMERFMTNHDYDIPWSKDLPAFVFYFNDEHIYLITDKQMRHSLLNNTSNKADIISLLSKERKVEDSKTPKNIVVDLPFEKWTDVSNTKIFITVPRLVHETFYKLIIQGDVYNGQIKMNEKEGIVRFQYENKNTIIFNPDYHIVNKTIETLGDKYTFKNQRIHTLAREYLDNEFGGLPMSSMNSSGDKLFHSEHIRNCQFNGWFKKPKTKELKAFDYNKHYTSCLMGLDLKYGFPVYNVFDEIKPFDGKIEAGFYGIESKNFFPFHGNGFYIADLIDYALKQNIIKLEQIKYQYKPSTVLSVNYFKKFINAVYKNFENPKAAINGMIGLMGHDFRNKNKHIFTSNSEFSFMETVINPDIKTKYIYNDEFLNNENDKPIDINKLNITDCYKSDKPLCYHLYNMKQVKSFQNDLPIFYAIYNISAMKMHQLHRKIGGSLVGVFTDTIIVEGNINKVACNKHIIGGIRETDLKEFTQLTNTDERTTKYNMKQLN